MPNGFVTVPNAKWDLQDLKRFVNWFKSGVLESSNFVATYQKVFLPGSSCLLPLFQRLQYIELKGAEGRMPPSKSI